MYNKSIIIVDIDIDINNTLMNEMDFIEWKK